MSARKAAMREMIRRKRVRFAEAQRSRLATGGIRAPAVTGGTKAPSKPVFEIGQPAPWGHFPEIVRRPILRKAIKQRRSSVAFAQRRRRRFPGRPQ